MTHDESSTMSNVMLWIKPRVENAITQRDTVLNSELYAVVFTDTQSPTTTRKRAVASVLDAHGFMPTLHHFGATDKRQIWKRANTELEREYLKQVINIMRAGEFVQSHARFELSEFIDAAVGVTSVEIQRIAGAFLRGLGYEPRQRRIGKRRVSLWADDWEA